MTEEGDGMDFNDGTAATPAEKVWKAVQPEFENLKGDIVCLTTAPAVKAQVKKKFEARETSLKSILTDKVTEADHTECRQRVADLEKQLLDKEAALQQEQATVACSAKTVKDLRDTVQSLRDELKAHGIWHSLDERLRHLGFGEDVNTSASSDSAYWYGSNRNVH